MEEFRDGLSQHLVSLWKREHTVVLHGSATQAGAWDIESRFTEAALGTTQVADYRHFAHGRHHWLAKRAPSTGVLAFVAEDDVHLAERTLRLLPPEVEVAPLHLGRAGTAAGVAAIITSIYAAGLAGAARGIDPGRPGVPRFGSRIYSLSTYGTVARASIDVPPLEAAAIARKAGRPVEILLRDGELAQWRAAYSAFADRIRTARFASIIFDWDGTLYNRCSSERADPAVAAALNVILQAGVPIGIATGRGRSVRDELRSVLPIDQWRHVFVGYYNASDIGRLDDTARPDAASPPEGPLQTIADCLLSDPWLRVFAKTTTRRKQITVELLRPDPTGRTWEICRDIVQRSAGREADLVCSTHSVDIVTRDVSKCALIAAIVDVAGLDQSDPILCIGDRGAWPGNDFQLLATRWALSVDSVSPDRETGWNLAPPGHKGVQATIGYLSNIEVSGSPPRARLLVPTRSLHRGTHG